jgi:hypothetical protein
LNNLAITPELDAPLQLLDSYLSFLRNVLAQAPLLRVSRTISNILQSYLWDYVLLRHTFSTTGIAQFRRDIGAIWDVMDKSLGDGQGETSMMKLRDGVELLSLPLKGEDESIRFMGLEEAERGIFQSNDKAREILGVLNLTTLTESEARGLLERRAELGS